MVKKKKKLLVFLSHASQDKTPVRELCQKLKLDGFDPWLDEEYLLPGMDWNLEVEKALRASDVILLCFSNLSIKKEGYIQREFKRAMKYKEEKPEGTIYVIPVRLDNCELPNFIQDVQWVDYPSGYNRLVVSLNFRNGKITPVAPLLVKNDFETPSQLKNSMGGINISATKVDIGGDVVNGSKYIYGSESSKVNSVVFAFKEIQKMIDYLPYDPSADKSYLKLFISDIEKEIRKGDAFDREKIKSSLKLLKQNSEEVYLFATKLIKSQDFNISSEIRELIDSGK